jgi:hypothetical protein
MTEDRGTPDCRFRIDDCRLADCRGLTRGQSGSYAAAVQRGQSPAMLPQSKEVEAQLCCHSPKRSKPSFAAAVQRGQSPALLPQSKAAVDIRPIWYTKMRW